MRAQKLTKNGLKATKLLLEKSAKKKKMKTFKIFGGFWGPNYFFW